MNHKPLLFSVVLLSAVAFRAPLAMAQAPNPNAANSIGGAAVNLLNNSDFARGQDNWGVPNERADFLFLDAPKTKEGATLGGRILHLDVRPEAGARPWDIVLRQKLDAKLNQGEALIFRGWMRSPQSAEVGVFVEEDGGTYAKSLAQTLKLTPQWKEFEVRGQALSDLNFGASSFVMHLGGAKATIEMANLRLLDPDAKSQALGRSSATPDKPQSVVGNGDFSGDLNATWNGFGATPDATVQASMVASGRTDWTRALRLQAAPPAGAQPWNLKISQKSTALIGRDDAIYIRAWLRSPERARVSLVYEQASEPFTKFINRVVKLSPEWKEFRFAGYAPRAFEAGEAQFNIFVGYEKATVEIGDVRIENYGHAPRERFSETIDYSGGIAPDDSWRAPALNRIEKLRKGDVSIRVVDAQNRPVRNAKIHLEQKKPWFRWGTAVPVSRLLDSESPNNVRLQSTLKGLFNTVVFESDLKWPNSESSGMLDKIDRGIDWLNAAGIQNIRGHNMVWGSEKYLPKRVVDLDKDATIAAIREHIQTVGARMRGKVYVWDVVNEAADNVWLWDKIGWDKFAEVYRWAREADPKVLLAYNDYHAFGDAADIKRKAEFERIQYLIDHGAPFDIIGEQAHLGAPLIPIGETIKRIDELAKFGKRIEITEFDVGVTDDKTHSDYTRDFLTAMFSQPQVDAFLMWGFWEGSHWRAAEGGAMIRKDWSERPAALIYRDLLFHQWWTKADLQSNAQGQSATRAFYGTHQITISQGQRRATQEISLVPNGAKSWTIVLK